MAPTAAPTKVWPDPKSHEPPKAAPPSRKCCLCCARGKSERRHPHAALETGVVLATSLALALFYLWLLTYVRWNTADGTHATNALEVQFQDGEECSPLSSFFVQQIKEVSVLGGSSASWEEILQIPDGLTETTFRLHATNRSFVAAKSGLVLALPSYVLRALSLNTLSRSDKVVTLFVSSANATSPCPVRFGNSEPAQAALVSYLLARAKVPDLGVFSVTAAGKRVAWTCDLAEPDLRWPEQLCKPEGDPAFAPLYVIFGVVWGVAALIGLVQFSFLASAFYRDNLHEVSTAAQGHPSELRDDLNLFVNIFKLLFVVGPSGEGEGEGAGAGPGRTTAADSAQESIWRGLRRMAVLLIPVVLPALASLNLACEMGEDMCSRHTSMQIPIFGVVVVYLVALNVFLLGTWFGVFQHAAHRIVMRCLVLTLCGVSVCCLVSHMLWMLLACTVRPAQASSRIVSVLSILVYAQQTWKRLLAERRVLVAKLGGASAEVAGLKAELIRHGFSTDQLRSFVLVSTAGLVLCFVWLVLCGMIFYARRSESSSALLSVLFGLVFPLCTALMHITVTVRKRAAAASAQPEIDLLDASAEALAGANAAADLTKINEGLSGLTHPDQAPAVAPEIK